MIRDHLQAIYDEYGKLTPALVVEVASAKDHPLHDRIFDCKPAVAAARYYQERAHDLIQSVKVVYREPDSDGQERSVRAFHAVPSQGPDRFVYEPVEKVAQDPFLRELVKREMEREWRTLLARYEHFDEFLELVEGYVKRETA